MKNRRYILLVLLVIWMTIIFMFSSQNGKKSESLSDRVTSTTIDIVAKITNSKISEKKKEEIIDNTRLIVRKSAHFASYFILGILIYLIFSSRGVKHMYLYTVLICFLYACTDEVHQLFSYKRTARVLDVIIDTCGSITACLTIYFINRYKRFKK